MKRRAFLVRGSLLTTGYSLMKTMPLWAGTLSPEGEDAGLRVGEWTGLRVGERSGLPEADLYRLFNNPTPTYGPFVGWWWNGHKWQKEKLARGVRWTKESDIAG